MQARGTKFLLCNLNVIATSGKKNLFAYSKFIMQLHEAIFSYVCKKAYLTRVFSLVLPDGYLRFELIDFKVTLIDHRCVAFRSSKEYG